ncbi:unnamed protein product [Knipowitschia caucasica]
MNRKLRTTLPSYTEMRERTEVHSKMDKLKLKQKHYFDRSTKPLSTLAKEDVVRIRDQDAWNRKATVLQEVGLRSYEVRTEDGSVLRRNRRHLLKTKEHFQESSCDVEDEHAVSIPTDTIPVKESTEEEASSAPVLRRSGRQTKKPDRLML